MKTNSISIFLLCVAGLLLVCPCLSIGQGGHQQTMRLLRGADESKVPSMMEDLLDLVSSMQQEHKDLIERISSLEQERYELNKRVAVLEESQGEAKEQYERRLGDSCIAYDSLESGAFVLSGCNVYVQSGGGRTDAITGKGNLVIGYNELDNDTTNRTGSHNLVIGIGHQYKGHSGFVSGRSNSLNADYGAILGHHNAVDGLFGTVGGGHSNVVKGQASHAAGGCNNVAEGSDSTILGGFGNKASATGSAIIGGRNHVANKQYETEIGNDLGE